MLCGTRAALAEAEWLEVVVAAVAADWVEVVAAEVAVIAEAAGCVAVAPAVGVAAA